MSAFDAPARYTELMGRRSLIIALGDDEESQQIAQHLWMRFQRAGKEAVIMNCRTLFPASKGISDGIDLAKRARIESIVTVGNQSCIDMGKAIRETLESGLPSSRHLSSILALKAKNTDAKRYVTPLIAIPTNVTPTTASSTWRGLHIEEDYVQEFACRPPEIVVFDSSLMKDMSIENISLYLLASLFDIIYSYAISVEFNRIRRDFRAKAKEDKDDSLEDDVKSNTVQGKDILIDTVTENHIMGILQQPEFKPILLLLLDIGMLQNMEINQEKVYHTCKAINNLQNTLFFDPSSNLKSLSDVLDPSVQILSQLSFMRMLHASDTSLNVPHNLLLIDTFQNVLKNSSLFKSEVNQGDSDVEVSIRKSFLTTVSILGLSPQGGLAANIMKWNATKGMPTKIRSELDDVLTKTLDDGNLSAGGIIMGAQYVEESAIEGHITNVARAKNNVIEGIYENQETADVVADVQKFSPKLGLLKSDFLLDLVENSF